MIRTESNSTEPGSGARRARQVGRRARRETRGPQIGPLSLSLSLYIHIYIYICRCRCRCRCISLSLSIYIYIYIYIYTYNLSVLFLVQFSVYVFLLSYLYASFIYEDQRASNRKPMLYCLCYYCYMFY